MHSCLPRAVVALLLGLAGSIAAAPATAQVPTDWDPARLHVTRAELQDLLSQYEAVASSNGYSSGVRNDARRSADRIRTRLERGDFGTGDRIVLSVENHEDEVPDTLVVQPGPSIVLPQMGTISLRGVLRSELVSHLSEEIGVYIREPVVHAASMIRLQIDGAVGTQAFYTLPSDMLLTEALNQAGLAQGADIDGIELRRGERTLMEDEEVSVAIQEGRSLDQLNLQAGDRIVVPEEQPSRIWPTVFRWSAIVASSLLLGIRVF